MGNVLRFFHHEEPLDLLLGIDDFKKAAQKNNIVKAKLILNFFPKNRHEIINLSEALIVAAKRDHIEFIQFLTEQKELDIDFMDAADYTALNHAVTAKKYKSAIYLIQAGADVNKYPYGSMLTTALGSNADLAVELVKHHVQIDRFHYLLASEHECFDAFVMLRHVSRDAQYDSSIKQMVAKRVAYSPVFAKLVEMSLEELEQADETREVLQKYSVNTPDVEPRSLTAGPRNSC